MSDTSSNNPVSQALEDFVGQLIRMQPEPPRIPWDSQWPSACYLNEARDGEPAGWRPVKQTRLSDMFERLGEALKQPIHPDIVAFYSTYWSDPLPASSKEGQLSLIQVWNDDDLERLRSNLIGHALAKQKQRQPLTLFFATTEPDGDYFLSVNNEDGSVWLEQPGKKPIRPLADSLAEFINRLTPDIIPDQE